MRVKIFLWCFLFYQKKCAFILKKKKINKFCVCFQTQDEFRKGRPKSVVVPETIDAVRQLILQDRHMIYCEIETRLSISGTRIHSIWLKHLSVKKKNCSRWIPHNQSDKSAATIGSNACKSV